MLTVTLMARGISNKFVIYKNLRLKKSNLEQPDVNRWTNKECIPKTDIHTET